jgi:hypothetical protein
MTRGGKIDNPRERGLNLFAEETEMQLEGKVAVVTGGGLFGY